MLSFAFDVYLFRIRSQNTADAYQVFVLGKAPKTKTNIVPDISKDYILYLNNMIADNLYGKFFILLLLKIIFF